MADPFDASSVPSADRGAWKSKLGFILAASGSAIGLGNIVFFASNAYQYGGGAFYLPYFIALFVLGLPVMIVEFSLGTKTGTSFPVAMRKLVGKKGEYAGWWTTGGALFITMYYIAILGWALAMLVGAFGGLLTDPAVAPFTPFLEPSDGPNAQIYFFGIIATWWPLLAVAVIWALTILILWRGTATIEKAVRVFVPLMWLFMIGLIVRGITLEGGVDGVLYLFTPDFSALTNVQVWSGAFAQMFFSLSLGLGTMTAYASYLPRNADQVNNSLVVSLMNCGFEYIAGIAIFAMLFAFSLNSAGTTLSLSFFVIPQGIAALPFGVKAFGVAFFFLLVIAGLTSAVSLVEGVAAPLIDKLGITRKKALTLVLVPGIIGSLACTLPFVVDPDLNSNGVLGLTLVDIIDNWVFRYSLIVGGFLECLLIGWVMGAANLRAFINEHSRFHLGAWFDWMIKLVIPGVLGVVIFFTLRDDLSGGLYGADYTIEGFEWLPVAIPIFWILTTVAASVYLTNQPTADPRPHNAPADALPSTPADL